MESNAEDTQDEGQESKGSHDRFDQPLTFARLCVFFFGDICVCASPSGLTYLQWLLACARHNSSASIQPPPSSPIAFRGRFLRGSNSGLFSTGDWRLFPQMHSAQSARSGYYRAFNLGIWRLMEEEEKRGGRIVRSGKTRSGFMEHTNVNLSLRCCTITPNERLDKEAVRRAAQRRAPCTAALFSVRCGGAASPSSRRSRFDRHRRSPPPSLPPYPPNPPTSLGVGCVQGRD